MTGRFIAIVGPSGVGKDSVMTALADSCATITLARRVITRPSDAGGEDFDGVSLAEFQARSAAGDFAMQWQAHGLHYGLPTQIDASLTQGFDVLANLSRAVLPEAQTRFQNVEVILLTAGRDVLASRLHGRGRESQADIKRRLERAEFSLPQGVEAHRVDNSGALNKTVQTILGILYADTSTDGVPVRS